MLDGNGRLTLGRMRNPVRGFLHGGAALASVLGARALCARGGGGGDRIALLIFAGSLIALFSVSSLYHSFPWSEVWKRRMQRLDHSMIYVLIAGTYTPVAWIVLDGWLCGAALVVAWGIAGAGILQKVLWPALPDGYSIALQTTQGWLALPLIVPLAQKLPYAALALTALGGVFYTVGMICMVTHRPRLWPRAFSYHEMFHVFVIAGGLSHYVLMFAYVSVL